LEKVNNLDFPLIRYLEDNTEMGKFDLIKSIHNDELEIYTFRHEIVDNFESVLRTNSSRFSVGKFSMSNVSAIKAKSFFSFAKQSLQKQNVNSSFSEVSNIKSKDILLTKKESVRDVINISDTIVKVNVVTNPQNTIALDIPYPSILRGYLSNHFFKFPAGITLQRSGIGCLDTYMWDYIPVNTKPISVVYNFCEQSLKFEFAIASDHNKDIDDNKTHIAQLKEYENTLLNTYFYDHIFGWNFVVKSVEYNTDIFSDADNPSKKKVVSLLGG